ncbi:MAG: SDR family NAD(P)-dependent oxidoreductase [Alphaproteobacteria bacterium]
MQLERKRVIITGGSSGIGQALAMEAAARGAHLLLVGRRREALERTLAQLPGTGHMAVAADVTRPEDRARLMALVRQSWGGLDILVNNAGVVPVGPILKTSDADLETTVLTNLVAPITLCREAIPLLLRGQRPRIVNIGSVLGDIPYPLFATYSATKSGLRGFSIALRRELAPMGIGVTYAAPRATRTAASASLVSLIKPFNMTLDAPQKVAKLVWGAVMREANSVYPKGPERLFVLLQRLIPHLVDKSIAKQLSRVGVR